MLYYPNQVTRTLIGTKSGTTRTSWALTNAYQAEGTTKPTKTIEIGGYSELVLDCLYTTGTAETNNSVELKIEASPDGTNFYTLSNEAASGGTSTMTQREFTFVGAAAATAYAFSLRLDISYLYAKVWAKESGVAANAGTLYVEATLSGE